MRLPSVCVLLSMGETVVPRIEAFGRRAFIGVDVAGYSGRDDRHQHEVVRLVREATEAAGFDRSMWIRGRQGDGMLGSVSAGVVEPRLVDELVRHLDAALDRYNRYRLPEARMRVRVAIHHGVALPA